MFSWFKFGSVLTLTVLLPVSVLAYVSPGQPTGFVNDYAGVLSVDQAASLEQELQTYEQVTTNEIVVVTVPDLGGDTVENYAEKLFQEWGIGKAEEDNGALILVAVADRKMRIEVGYGLEPYLTDIESSQIINEVMKPAFQAGDFYAGLSGAVSNIEKILNGEQLDLPTASTEPSVDYSGLADFLIFGFFIFAEVIVSVLARTKSWWGGGLVGGIIAFLVYFFIGVALAISAAAILIPLGLLIDYLVSKSYDKAKASGRPWVFFGGGSGRGGGSSFSGFGGGSSGGGGASGGW